MLWGGAEGAELVPSFVPSVAEVLRALWQYDLELIELSNPKLPPPSKKAKKEL